ncbi:DUF721 domain-containing protein [Pelagicoccus sp. SDUM812003]|uniref:DUF721 domain-containing protein n=1 Tax=Pelagicoccus sp. SDUM812003 TaxID=3041267 RepID=UPI00280D5778|nr:DUF721 domain-containing protein [Pelagicoccus sp. SDUM812003]MDQ8202462.1 DUF721 domain-containing protein [Pelagicoccus sp. SDUM812003]
MAKHPYNFRKNVERLIANFRGIPENYPGEAPKTDKSMESVLDRILTKYKIGVESLEDRINENWPQIVGASNARNCTPSRIERERTLIIAVSNPIIRQELEFNKRLIMQNLHRLEGAKKIRSIVFKSG